MIASGSAPLVLMLGFGFLAALPAIGSALGKLFGGASEASASNQLDRAKLEQNRAAQQAGIYGQAQNAQMQAGNLDLSRQQFENTSESDRLRRALVGQLLGNARSLDIDIPGIPKANITGGLSVDSLGQGGKDIGAEMTARALSQLRAQPRYQGGQLLAPPTVPEIGKTGGNSLLNTIAGIASGIGGLGSVINAGQSGQAAAPPAGAITGQLPPNLRF